MSLESMHPLLYPPPPAAARHVLQHAPGWFLLSLVLISTLFVLGYWYTRTCKPSMANEPANPLAEALEQLQQLPRPVAGDQAGPWLQQLNLLLKRFCAVRYPDIASHKLSGREWLAFLDSRCPAAGLTRWMVLVQGSYLPDCRLDAPDIEALHRAVSHWMRAHV